MSRVALAMLGVIAAFGALVSGGWLVVAQPSNGIARVGLYLAFLVAVGVVALWVCEAHAIADTHARRVASSLAAGAVAAGLLAAILPAPAQREASEGIGPRPAASTELGPPTAEAPRSPFDPGPLASTTTAPPSSTAIDVTVASRFFVENYFPTALRDPDVALQSLGTPDFRKQKERTGVASYVKFYRDTLSIPVDQVDIRRHGTSANAFDVRFLRVLRSGTTSKVATVYVLTCDSAQTASAFGCASDELRVKSSANLR